SRRHLDLVERDFSRQGLRHLRRIRSQLRVGHLRWPSLQVGRRRLLTLLRRRGGGEKETRDRGELVHGGALPPGYYSCTQACPAFDHSSWICHFAPASETH